MGRRDVPGMEAQMGEKRLLEAFDVVDSSSVRRSAVSRIETDTQEVTSNLRDGREIRATDETELRYEIVKTGEALLRVS